MIDEINRYRILNKLKSVYRFSSVEDRKESSAEHSWGCVMLADFFLSKIDQKIDRLKIYELLMYHDVVEIESGDFPLHPEFKHFKKEEKEKQASLLLSKSLPITINKKFLNLFQEFEKQKTLEAKFAKAIDALEVVIHEMDYKKDWKGWTKEFLIEKKLKYFKEFPLIEKTFYEILNKMEEKGYFNQ